MSQSIEDQTPQIKSSGKGINKLISGTESVQTGIQNVEKSLRKLQNGIDQNKKGVAAIKDEIKGAKRN